MEWTPFFQQNYKQEDVNISWIMLENSLKKKKKDYTFQKRGKLAALFQHHGEFCTRSHWGSPVRLLTQRHSVEMQLKFYYVRLSLNVKSLYLNQFIFTAWSQCFRADKQIEPLLFVVGVISTVLPYSVIILLLKALTWDGMSLLLHKLMKNLRYTVLN